MAGGNGFDFRIAGSFVRGIHRSPVDSPKKRAVTRTLMFSGMLSKLFEQLSCRWFETSWRSWLLMAWRLFDDMPSASIMTYTTRWWAIKTQPLDTEKNTFYSMRPPSFYTHSKNGKKTTAVILNSRALYRYRATAIGISDCDDVNTTLFHPLVDPL